MKNENDLSKYFGDIANVSSIFLRKKITTKDIYIILLTAKLINKEFSLQDIQEISKHIESFFEYSKTSNFSNKDEFDRWQKSLTNKINNNQEKTKNDH